MWNNAVHWQRLRVLLYHIAWQQCDRGVERDFAYPAPEELELPWEQQILPKNIRTHYVVKCKDPARAILDTRDLPEARVDTETVVVEPLVWSWVKRKQDGEIRWYGLAPHPYERIFILFHGGDLSYTEREAVNQGEDPWVQ